MSATAGRVALVKVPGAAVAFTQEATTANGARTVYTITNSAKSVWDPQVAVLVETSPNGTTGWATASPSSYALNRLAGTVTFATPLGAGYFTRVSGSYLPMSVVAGAKSFTYTLTAAILNSTGFDDAYTSGGFPTKSIGLFDAQGTLARWYQNPVAGYFRDALLNATVVVLEFSVNRAVGYDCRIWALLDKQQIAAAVSSLVDDTIDWQGVPDADGNVVSN